MKAGRATLRRVAAVERLVELMRQEERPAVANVAACAILDFALASGRVKLLPLGTDGGGKRRSRYDFSGLTTAEKLDLEAALSAALEGRREP